MRLYLFALPFVVALISSDAQAAPECLTSSGKTACGHHCQAGYGQVRCAQSAHGVCTYTSGMVACWDPPPLLQRAYEERVPRPSCVSAGGQIACGYHCVSSYERPQCAQTPFGACRSNEGRAVCWDPPGQVFAQLGARTPVASCSAAFGKVACGYSCAAHDGELRCSQTPGGFCRVQQGAIVCWDPPLEGMQAVFEPGAERACMEAAGARTCGYRCLSSRDAVRCGDDRRAYCRLEADGIDCLVP
jgi:hypothetical protein